MLNNKQLVLAKREVTFNVDPTPTAAANAIQSEEPEFTTDFTVLERNFIKPNWSRTAHAIGRKLAALRFTTEVKNGGTAGVQCKFGLLLSACGFKESVFAAAVTGAAQGATTSSITLAGGDTAGNSEYVGLVVSITAGTGIGSSAKILAYNATTKVATVDAWVGGATPVAADTYSIQAGVTYVPSSDPTDHESLTLYLYKDGLLHIMTGCYGTVSFDCAVNNYGKATFEFIGQYYTPTDVALPTQPVFEAQKPQQIEEMGFTINEYSAVISRLALDAGVAVLPRLDANGTDGYNGTYISGRSPTGGIDPEAALVADEDFWTRLSAATEMRIEGNIGTSSGNIIRFNAQKAQYTGMSYAARDTIQTLDAALAFNDNGLGDDEYTLAFV